MADKAKRERRKKIYGKDLPTDKPKPIQAEIQCQCYAQNSVPKRVFLKHGCTLLHVGYMNFS